MKPFELTDHCHIQTKYHCDYCLYSTTDGVVMAEHIRENHDDLLSTQIIPDYADSESMLYK